MSNERIDSLQFRFYFGLIRIVPALIFHNLERFIEKKRCRFVPLFLLVKSRQTPVGTHDLQLCRGLSGAFAKIANAVIELL